MRFALLAAARTTTTTKRVQQQQIQKQIQKQHTGSICCKVKQVINQTPRHLLLHSHLHTRFSGFSTFSKHKPKPQPQEQVQKQVQEQEQALFPKKLNQLSHLSQ
jgi:hypothetical protein